MVKITQFEQNLVFLVQNWYIAGMMGDKYETKIGIAKVKILKSGSHIHIQNFLKNTSNLPPLRTSRICFAII